MATLPAQIDLWRTHYSEAPGLEFKEAKNQFDSRKLCDYCVAIANEGGGLLILGVQDKPPRVVVGTSAFNNPVALEQKLLATVGFRVSVEEVAHPDGRVLVFHVPPRPRGTAYHVDGKYLMRAGEQLLPMTEDHLRRIFSEGEFHWAEESAIQKISPQQVIELLDLQAFFELLQLPYPSSHTAILDRLLLEHLIDETDGLHLSKIWTGRRESAPVTNTHA